MHRCPICNQDNPTLSCEGCGFDASRDYESMPTLTLLTGTHTSMAQLRKKRELQQVGILRCPNCGCDRFHFSFESSRHICCDCSKQMTPEIMHQLRQEYEDQKRAELQKQMNRSTAEGSGNTMVLAIGCNDDGQCNVDNWKNMVAVATGPRHTVGLKSDGTVVATGHNIYGQCDISKWRNIISIAAGTGHTVGLTSGGHVVARGYNRFGQCDTASWVNITAVAAGTYHTVGLQKNGTVVATGNNLHGQCDVSHWRNIVSIAAGFSHTVGLRKDGTVAAAGINEKMRNIISKWTDIVAVAVGSGHVLAIRVDGILFSTGSDQFDRCDMSDWNHLRSISASSHHTVGLRKDGTVVAVGSNLFGRCAVQDWNKIVAVATGEGFTVALKDLDWKPAPVDGPDVALEKGLKLVEAKKHAEAVPYLQQAVDAGDPRAKFALGKLYVWGSGVPKNPELGDWMICAAANAGHIPACTHLGMDRFKQKRYASAWKWFSKAIEKEDPTALFYAYKFYMNGYHVAKNPQAAIRFLNRAANAGSREAKTLLENMPAKYQNG